MVAWLKSKVGRSAFSTVTLVRDHTYILPLSYLGEILEHVRSRVGHPEHLRPTEHIPIDGSGQQTGDERISIVEGRYSETKARLTLPYSS